MATQMKRSKVKSGFALPRLALSSPPENEVHVHIYMYEDRALTLIHFAIYIEMVQMDRSI